MSQPLPVLNRRFRERPFYGPRAGTGYALLPLRFIALDDQRFLLTNFAGEYAILPQDTVRAFLRHELASDMEAYEELQAKHFLFDSTSTVALDLLAVKYRTKQAFLSQLTGLFLFVVSLRCEHSCPYCQVSRQSADRQAYDMTEKMADRAIEFVFRSPSPTIKVEFQGGEPLLNFPLIRYIVNRVEDRNQSERRDLQFVIATNLALLTDEVLDFCQAHNIYFSTSLDGPRALHNQNRPRPGHDSYEKTIDGLGRICAALGPKRVSALMTTTPASLTQPEAIVDEYVAQGLTSIFLRPISPYGFAVRTGLAAGYDTADWLDFYQTALTRIIDWNSRGTPLREEYATLILRKALTPYATGYVDLQSPAGLGIGALVFNYNGDIYASDEARMLAETGDETFRLGNVLTDSFETVLLSERLLETLAATMTEGMPMCSDCGFQPYCGSDPVFHHATQGDPVGFKPTSGFCQKNMGVMRHLFRLLEDDERAANVLKSWISVA